MEGRRDDVAAGAMAAAQGRRWRRSSGVGGGGGEESDGSSVELSLQLRTGDSSGALPAAAVVAALAAEEERQAAARRRTNMTIFYDGRVCAVDVTEVQARAIISMANEEMIMAAADSHRQQCHQRDRQLQDSGGSSSSAAVARCARDGHVRPVAAAAAAAGCSRQGFATVAAAPVIDQAASGLSMKRSLQRFLQKRKARTGGAVAPPYAAGWHAQAMRH